MTHVHHHPHPKQPDIEDAPLGHHETLVEAVLALLVEKGVLTADDIRRTLEDIDSRSPADGARLVARSWVDLTQWRIEAGKRYPCTGIRQWTSIPSDFRTSTLPFTRARASSSG